MRRIYQSARASIRYALTNDKVAVNLRRRPVRMPTRAEE